MNINILTKHKLISLTILILLFLSLIDCNDKNKTEENQMTNNLAIDGYDPVSYFKEGKPVIGKPEISTEWNQKTWTFSSEENKTSFTENPNSYSPMFNGQCSFATSLGKTEKGNPENWQIKEGKLYLNSNPIAHLLWKILPGRLKKAEENFSK